MKGNDLLNLMLNSMIVLVANRFDGRYDKGGKPYFLHCAAVMTFVDSDEEEVKCIALGHDLVEDTKTTYTELRDMFTPRIVEGIHAMTKQRGQTEEQYLDQIKANRDAVLVKLADLQHNSDIRRLKGITQADFTRIQKYHRMYLDLKALVLSWNHTPI